MRRINRSGGKTANEKLAGDIIALAKFHSAREVTLEFYDMFKRSGTNFDTFVSSQE